jgi:signal transduction histidine kinase
MTVAAPLPANEDQRLAALQGYCVLDTPADERFDRITALAADIFDAPIALVSLVDTERQWFKSRYGLGTSETPRELAFCAYTILGTEPFVVEDASEHPLFRSNPLVCDSPDIRFYAGAPLIEESGYRLGSLCIIDRRPRRFSQQDAVRLKMLAAIVVDELSLHKAQAQSEEVAQAHAAANAMKDRFLTSMNHEFRTPLNAVLGFSQILEMNANQRLGPEELECVAAMKEAGENLLRLTDGMMTMARLESGTVPIACEAVDVHALVEDVFKLHQPSAILKRIDFSTQPGDTSAGIHADRAHLLRILGNFISNAFKYTPPGGRVTLGWTRDCDDITLYVEDTGCGIPAARQREAFQLFNRLGHEGSTIAGLGLGLAIASRLAHSMDGTIGFESREGIGSRFWIRFPAI